MTPKTNDDRLALLKYRLELAKRWAKKPHEAWKSWIREYEIEDFGDTGEIRDKVRVGYIFRKTESDQPAIFDDQPDLFIKGRKANIKPIEPLIEGVYDYLWDVQNLEEKIEDMGPYFTLLGMAFIESPWVTKTKKVPEPVLDPQGQPVIDLKTSQPMVKLLDAPIIDNPMAEVDDPFKYYFSPETKFAPILDYEHCPYYFHERVWTKERIKAKYGMEVESGETLKVDNVDFDEPDKQSEVVKSDMQRVTAYEYYGCLPEDMAPDKSQWEYDKDYHCIITGKEEILVEECPYPYKPMFILGNYGMANKFWKFGDAKHLIPLVQEFEKYRSQILKYTRKMANPKPLLPAEGDIDEEAFRNPDVGVAVKYANGQAPTYLSPAPLGREVSAGVEMVRVDLEKTAGSFDLENGGSQSTVRSPKGIQVFSEASDRNTRRKRKKIARLIRQLVIFQFMQLAQNWKPEDNHSVSVIGEGGPQDVQMTGEVLQVIGGVSQMYNLDIEVESLSINRAQMRQDSLDLWALASQQPNIFNLPELAKDLLQNGFNKKDPDRYLLTEEQRQALAKPPPEQPKVNVSIKADATTPPGAALLENEGLLQQGQGTQAVVDNQVMQQEAAQINQGRQMAQMDRQASQSQAQAITQGAFKGGGPSV